MFSYFLYGTLLIKNQQFAYTYFFVFLILFIKIMIEFFFYNAKGLINLMLLMGFAYLLSRIAIKTIKKISKPETKQLVFAVLSIVFYILTSFTNAVARVKKLQYLEIDGVERIGVYKPLAKESWKDNGWKPSSKMVFQTEDKVFIMKVIDMMKKTRPYSYDRGESIKDPNLMCFYRKKNEKGFCVRIGKGTRFSNNTVRIDTSEASAYVSFELYEEKDILFQNDFHD